MLTLLKRKIPGRIPRPLLLGIPLLLLALWAGVSLLPARHRRGGLKRRSALAQAVTVQTAAAKAGSMASSLDLVGTVVSRNQVNVAPAATGPITAIDVHVGETVQAGEVLAQLDTSLSRTQLAGAQAAEQAAQAKLQALLAGPTPAQKLVAATALQNAQNTLNQAKADVATVLGSNGPTAVAIQNAQNALQQVQSSEGTVQAALQAAETNLTNAQNNLSAVTNVQNINQQSAAQSAAQADQSVSCRVYGNGCGTFTTLQAQAQANQTITGAQGNVNSAQAGVHSAQSQANAATQNAQGTVQSADAQRLQVAVGLNDQLVADENQLRTQEAAYQALLMPPTPQAVAQAQAGVSQAAATVQGASIGVSRGTVRSPISGVITARLLSVGAYDSPGNPIFTLQGHTREVLVTLSQGQLGQVHPGERAQIQPLSGGSSIAATVLRVEPAATTGGFSFQAMLLPDKPSSRLLPGATAAVTVFGSPTRGVLVPAGAVMTSSGTPQVFLDQGGRARLVNVTVSAQNGTWAVIGKGVRAGEAVITAGRAYLATGDKVVPTRL